MAVTNFLVSSLPDYVQQNRDLIIKSFALANTGTRARIGIQTGIKKSAYLNYLDLVPSFQDGSSCGFNPLDSITLTHKEIEVATIKVDGQICPETLLGKYGEWLVRVNATQNDLPFEQYIIDTLIAQINKGIEGLIWQGDTSNSDPIDGFLTQFAADGSVLTETIAAGTTAYEGILQVFLAMPEEAVERGGVIFVGPEVFRYFVAGLVAANYYHYAGPADAAPEEFVFPGTNVRVIKAAGLIGTSVVVGTFADNLVYGTDGENDSEAVDLWWSQDDRLFKYQVKWNSGVAYHFSNQIVVGTFEDTPTVSCHLCGVPAGD